MTSQVVTVKDRTGEVWESPDGLHIWLVFGPGQLLQTASGDRWVTHPAARLDTGQVVWLMEDPDCALEDSQYFTRLT